MTAGTTNVSGFVPGQRCVECHRYLFAEHRPTRLGGRRWRHESCDDLARPTDEMLARLAALLVYRHSSRLTSRLLQQWADSERSLADLDLIERHGLSSAHPDLGEQRRALRASLDAARAGLAREEQVRAERVAREWDELDLAMRAAG